MLALQIDDKNIENLLYSKFRKIENIKEYIINLISQDLSKEYQLWDKNELDYISKVDLSTPLEDNEDYYCNYLK